MFFFLLLFYYDYATIGDWFGPTTISETVAALIEQRPELESSLASGSRAKGPDFACLVTQ